MALSASELEKEVLSNQHCLQGLYNNSLTTETYFRLLEKLQVLKVRYKLRISTTSSEVQMSTRPIQTGSTDAGRIVIT